MNSVRENTLFNFLLTFSTILFPLVSMPYISKVLNVSDLGLINKGNAFAMLFTNLFSFGIVGFASRQVARIRQNKNKLDDFFFSVLIIHLVLTFIGLTIYLGYTFFFVSDVKTKNVFLLFSILFVVQPFSIEWLYSGLEEFKYISIRSLFVKILMLASLFVFVRKESDFFVYGILSVGAQGINTFFNIFNARKFIKITFAKFDYMSLLRCSKFFYFQTLLAICYQNINQLILGKDVEQLAYFVRGTTLVSLVGSFVGPIVNAVKPRLESIIDNDTDSYKYFTDLTFEILSLLVWPLGFGIAALSEEVMFLFGGEAFKSEFRVLMILAIGTIFTQYSVFFNTIVSTPAGYEKNTFWGNLAVAISALCLNPALIHSFGALGAAIALVFSEFLGMSVQVFLIKKEMLYLGFIKFKKMKYFLSAFLMFIVLRFIKLFFSFNVFFEILIYFVVGVFIYSFTLYITSVLLEDRVQFATLKKLIRR